MIRDTKQIKNLLRIADLVFMPSSHIRMARNAIREKQPSKFTSIEGILYTQAVATETARLFLYGGFLDLSARYFGLWNESMYRYLIQ